MSLGSQVEKYRKAFQIGYPELAELSGVEVGTINALEKRGSNRSNHFPALAKTFGLTLEQLADEATDYSATISAHIAALRNPGSVASSTHTAQETTPHAWIIEYWPFAVSRDTLRTALEREDIDRINAYIQATIDMRLGECKKNAA